MASGTKTQGRLGQLLLVAVALAAWAGVLLQLRLSMQLAALHGRPAWHGIGDALCYFTVLTNLLVALVASAYLARGEAFPASRAVLAASAVYILVVGLVYTLLLRALWAPVGLQKLADVLLHDAVPLLYVVWWLACAPRGGLNLRQVPRWLLYPLAYYAFTLILGGLTGRYLYPFANLHTLGLARVVANGALLLLLFFGLGALAVLFDGLGAPRRST
jgi:hypothetical protein